MLEGQREFANDLKLLDSKLDECIAKVNRGGVWGGVRHYLARASVGRSHQLARAILSTVRGAGMTSIHPHPVHMTLP